MVKSFLSVTFGLAFGGVLLFVGLLVSTAIAAPPQGPVTRKCTIAQMSAKAPEAIDGAFAAIGKQRAASSRLSNSPTRRPEIGAVCGRVTRLRLLNERVTAGRHGGPFIEVT